MKAALEKRLRELGSPERAAKEKSYQKSAWTHWGAAQPAMDRAIRETTAGADAQAMQALAHDLWAEPVWDCKVTAGRILALKAVPGDRVTWDTILSFLPDLDGWCVADNLAKGAGKCLLADPARLDQVEGWLDHGNMWVRRAALVFTLPWAKQGQDPERMLGWAARLSTDGRWFIQKAIGWWLRELSKHNPARVRVFLDAHGAALKGVARREATKYLPPANG